MVALMFVGTFGFMLSYDGFILQSQAACCCSGGQQIVSFAADSSGAYGSEIPMDAEPTGGCGSGKVSDSSGCCDDSQCECLGSTYACATSDCNAPFACGENYEGVVRKCGSDCGDCHLGDEGRPCSPHCSNADSDTTVCTSC